MMLFFGFSSVTTQDIIKEENLRDDLRYYFMSPCEKYRARRHKPWKMGVQILKIVMITTQVCTTPTYICDLLLVLLVSSICWCVQGFNCFQALSVVFAQFIMLSIEF